MKAIVEAVFPCRIEAVEALRETPRSSDRLRTAAAGAAGQAVEFGRAPGSADWSALADALEIAALLTEWDKAVRAAEADADRYVRAARQRLEEMRGAASISSYRNALLDCLTLLDAETETKAVAGLCLRLAALPMPVSIISDPVPERTRFADETRDEPKNPTVAFLEFTINGKPAASLHSLSPRQVHDLGLTIRVSHWPEESESLSIEPVSIEPASVWDLPKFSFARPNGGEAPHIFQRDGRMVIHAAQGFDARPLEFLYAAEFQPPHGRPDIVVAGQRRLRLDGVDLSSHKVTGYAALDRRLIEIRESLRSEPMISEADIRDLMLLLPPLANLTGAAVQDALYPKTVNEAVFEVDVRQRLRTVAAIGSELEQQPQVAGGKSDLSFRGIRIELKSEQKKRLVPTDCAAFAAQAASYAAGTGKRVAVLAVLDCSPKAEAPLPLDACLFLQPVNGGGGPIWVVTVLVQGGLARPSDLSR